jgi:LmbE family N-acetylglucosaminyl deacetylase
VNENRILVVAAHPDDEVIGCGGSVRKWHDEGGKVSALILAEGAASRKEKGADAKSEVEALRTQARNCAKIIGYDDIVFEDFPDNRMDEPDLLDVIKVVERYVKTYSPKMVITHHYGDLNVDHRIAFQAVLTACRPIKGGGGDSVKSSYCFETLSSTEWNFPYHKNGFSPNTFIDITGTISAKLRAFGCYQSEMRRAPHPRSVESIKAANARWGSVIECNFAEAFEQIYRIED